MPTQNTADFGILTTLAGLAGRYDKHYCYPTQAKLVQLLADFTGRHMSRRTLNRHLATLEARGWIKRQRRHRPDKLHGYVFRSTLYYLGRRTWRHLAGLTLIVGRAVARLGAQTIHKPCAIPGTISVDQLHDHRPGAPLRGPPGQQR